MRKFLLKGFTLTETLIAIAIFTIILVAISASVVMLYRTYGYTWQQSLAIDEARRGVETMVKEIRMARSGENGAYPLEKAADKELVFYSDIDGDGKVERVRYFLGAVSNGYQSSECQSLVNGGTCSVNFSNFMRGNLISAQVKISVEGDFGASNEYAEIFADGLKLGDICKGGTSGCSDCAGVWQGTAVFNVTQAATDNAVTFLADATPQVNAQCPHSMKGQFELSWTEDISAFVNELKKGVTKAVIAQNGEVIYPADQEKISVITSYVRNSPPIFEYFDKDSNKIEDSPARLLDTKLIKIYLVVNVDPNRPPDEFELQSYVQLRNLKEE